MTLSLVTLPFGRSFADMLAGLQARACRSALPQPPAAARSRPPRVYAAALSSKPPASASPAPCAGLTSGSRSAAGGRGPAPAV